MALRRVSLGVALLAVAAHGCAGDDAGSDTDAAASSDGNPTSDDAPDDAPDDGPDDTPDDEGESTAGAGTTGGSADDTAGPTSGSTGATDDDTGTTGTTMATCADNWPMWNDGTNCGEAAIQVHQVSDDTVILRQSLCTNFEGPFVYMMFGTERVLVEDTGAGGVMIASTIYSVIDDWLMANGRDSIELVVVNSHAHGDHVQGNSMFLGQPNTQVVGTGVGNVSTFFGIDNWPEQTVEFDLGGRVLDIIPIPGHESSHIAIYDHGENWLLTGDTLYPGRLYIADFPTYVESIERMVDHIAELPTCNVMGTHIEMTNTPGDDFPFGADSHPDEHPLQLTAEHVIELRDGVQAMAGNPVIEAFDDFIIYPLN